MAAVAPQTGDLMNDAHALQSLVDELTELRVEMLRQEAALEDRMGEISELHRDSARNLVHYITLRRHDIRDLQKEGVPSRSEITDAAAGVRAECVMLNKGPYIVKAVRALDDILKRMEGHQQKSRSTLRKLRLAELFQPYEQSAALTSAGSAV